MDSSIPQSKITDFCQPPLGKGAFRRNLKQLYKSEFDDVKIQTFLH